MTTDNPDGKPSERATPPRRRARYSGTHPKRFEQRYKELDPAAYPEVQDHVRAQGRTPAGTHVPVLVEEVLGALRPQPGDIVADCTIGYGGHALEFIQRIGPTGRLIGLDVDAAQIERTTARLSALADGQASVSLHRSHFAGLGKVLAREGLDGFDVVLADLGVSSMQMDDPTRGFSYKYDGLSRRDWRDRPADQRTQLHPAARTFQALRILVNDEKAALAQFLRIAPHCLRPGGRIGVISFHSGEDVLVENAFRDGLQTGLYAAIIEQPTQPTAQEITANPRGRSALFRWAIAPSPRGRGSG